MNSSLQSTYSQSILFISFLLKYTIYCCLIFICQTGFAQINPQIDSIGQSRRLQIGAEQETHYKLKVGTIDSLENNVKIYNDGMYMFCNQATVINKQKVYANGNVSILQSDSLQIFSDYLYYDNLSNQSKLKGEVIIVKNHEKYLHAEEVNYNLSTKIATYDNGATLINDNTKLISLKGKYELKRDLAYFYEKVSVTDSNLVIYTDSLIYNLKTNDIHFISGTRMIKDSTTITFFKGNYNLNTEKGNFTHSVQILTSKNTISAVKMLYDGKNSEITMIGNPLIENEDYTASADTIVYFENEEQLKLNGRAIYQDKDNSINSDKINYNLKTDEYTTEGNATIEGRAGTISAKLIYKDNYDNDVAQGSVEFKDTINHILMYSDRMYNNNKNKTKLIYNTSNQPNIVLGYEDEFPLHIFADSLRVTESKHDSSTTYIGKNGIKLFKEKVTATCDKFLFNTGDSIAILNQNPIMWIDSMQISGDTILLHIQDNELTNMEVLGNVFIIIKEGKDEYNQAKGEIFKAWFKDNKLTRATVLENVESLYFLKTNNELTGINHSFSSNLTFVFNNNKITSTDMKISPKSYFDSSKLTKLSPENLSGFNWRITERPNKKDKKLTKKSDQRRISKSKIQNLKAR